MHRTESAPGPASRRCRENQRSLKLHLSSALRIFLDPAQSHDTLTLTPDFTKTRKDVARRSRSVQPNRSHNHGPSAVFSQFSLADLIASHLFKRNASFITPILAVQPAQTVSSGSFPARGNLCLG